VIAKKINPIEFFNKKTKDNPVKMLQYHFHDNHELYYLEKGKTKYFIGNEIYLLEPGDMIFVPKGAFHKTDSEEKSHVDRLLFSFDDEFVGEEFAHYIRDLKEDKFIKISQKHMYNMQEIFNKIEAEHTNKNADYKEMQKLYLKQMLIFISRYRTKQKTQNLGEAYTIMQSAAEYISENCSGDLSLEFLSKKFSMSPSYFSKQFKAITGVGLNEYINVSRISMAEKLLLKTNKPITEIAMECGFNDSNYFASVFKKIKGITPKKYSITYKTAEKN